MGITIHKNLPPILYKYYPEPNFERDEFSEINLENRLKHGKIRLTDAKEVNDLFESDPTVEWDASVDDVYKRAAWIYDADPLQHPHLSELQTALRKEFPSKQRLKNNKSALFRKIHATFDETIKRSFQDIPFYCLSESPSSILMWAHYASNHKGVCIGYDTRGLQFPRISFPITYQTSRLVLRASDYLHDKGSTFKQLVYDILRTKSSNWKYEKEWRFFGTDLTTGRVYRANDEFDFERKFIAEIIFGERATARTRSTVLAHIADLDPRPRILQAQKSGSTYEIELHSMA